MKAAIMQPYFFPYIGYFQLIGAVDLFIVYDNIKYTKKGWINRNRILQDGHDAWITLPLKADSDFLEVRERELAAEFRTERLRNQIDGAYRRAPQREAVMPLVEAVLACADRNLFGFLHHAIAATCRHLGLRTEIRVSSTIGIDHGLKGEEKVLALCRAVGADTYLNPIGGIELYAKERFREQGIALHFLQARPLSYPQLGEPFVPWLSILDVLMFNPLEAVQGWIASHYDLH